MGELIFRRYKHEDKEQVLALLGNVLWDFPYEERLAYFGWKYEQNPYTDSPLGFVCIDGEKVIAFRGYMLQPLSFAGEIFFCAASGDTVTDSNYRRMGIFSRMTQYSLEELEKENRILAITNSSSGKTISTGLLKLGWYPLTKRGHLFSFSWRSFFPKREISYFSDCKIREIRIELSTECKAIEMGNLALSRIPSNLISVHTDETYANWRYTNPHAQYIFVYYYQQEKLKAYLVLKKIGNRKYDIVDYQCETIRQLRTLLSEVHRRVHPLYILNWVVNRNDVINKVPMRLGFINLDFVLKRIEKFRFPPFLIRTTKVCQSDQDWMLAAGVEMRNILNWNLNKIVADEM